MFGLVDIDKMYVSCQRVFRPDLVGKPVGVLSNNDGCLISLSSELKDLGLSMGTPHFMAKQILGQAEYTIFSSNYELYGDMSRRVMQVLTELAPAIEIYSIDEAFLDVSGILDLVPYGRSIKDKLLTWTGLPSCVGFGPTKTLAKMANRIAKKNAAYNGVFKLAGPDKEIMSRLDIEDVWGVGTRTASRLREIGIYTAWDLAVAEPRRIRASFNVVMEKVARELRGQPCLGFAEAPPRPQQIFVSRAFGQYIQSLIEIEQAVASYALRAAEKARQKHVYASAGQVFIQAGLFAAADQRYSNVASFTLSEPRNDTGALISSAVATARKIYKPGFKYQRAGICLYGLVPADARQASLFGGEQDAKVTKAMEALDLLNHKFGRGTISMGAVPKEGRWAMARQFLSPRYTTRWSELRPVR